MGNLDRIRSALKKKTPGRSQGGGDTNRYKFPDDTDEVRIRILPYKKGIDFPLKLEATHFDMPPSEDGDGKDTIVKCLAAYDKKCHVCKVIEKNEGRLDLSKKAATMTGSAVILVRKDPTQKINALEPHTTRLSTGIVKWLSELMDDEEAGSVFDINEGRDLLIKRKKKKGGFEVRPAFSSTPVAEDEEELSQIMAKVPDLDKLIKDPNDDDVANNKAAAERLAEYIENVLLTSGKDVGSDDEEEEEEDDEPKFDKKKKKPSDDEEEEEEDSDDSDDKDEDDKPSKGKKSKSDDEEEDEEEEDESDDEDEEDERPSKTKKKSKSDDEDEEDEDSGEEEEDESDDEDEEEEEQPKKKAAQPSKNPAKSKVKEEPKKEQKPVASDIKVPKNAPKCFGDSKEFDEESKKCTKCTFEFQCSSAIEKMKKAKGKK